MIIKPSRSFDGPQVCSLTAVPPQEYVIDFSSEQISLPDNDPNKGRIPIVVTESGTTVRRLGDSDAWNKLIAPKKLKKLTHVRRGRREVESEDEEAGEDDYEEEQYTGNRIDNNHGEVQYIETRTRSRSSNERPCRPTQVTQPQFRPKSIGRQQSGFGAADEEVTSPLGSPPLRSAFRTNVPCQQSILRGSTPVDPRSHKESSVLPNSRTRFAAQSATHSSHRFHSQPPPSGHRSHSHLPSHAGLRPSNSTHPRSLAPSMAPPPNIPLSGQGAKRRNPDWSDDGGTQPNTGMYFHYVDDIGRLVPRAEAGLSHLRGS